MPAERMVRFSPNHTIPIGVATTGSSVAMIPAPKELQPQKAAAVGSAVCLFVPANMADAIYAALS